MTKVNMSNVYRKVRSLLSKTHPDSGCTAGEKLAAYNMAKDICTMHNIERNRFDGWPSERRIARWTEAVGNGTGASGGETDEASSTERPSEAAMRESAKAKPKADKKKEDKPKRVKRGDVIIELMKRKEGVSIAELTERFGTQPHTCRAQISIEARKRGLKPTLKDGRYYV